MIPLFDAFHDDPDIRTFLVRHEQGAGHMAEGYAKATGRVGVCTAHLGPGRDQPGHPDRRREHGLGPDWCAITGQVGPTCVGTDGFQEADIVGITMPIVKHSFLIKDADDLPLAIHEAFHIAQTGRPGPVLVDIPRRPVGPRDVDCEPRGARCRSCPATSRRGRGQLKQIEAAARAGRRPRRPVIYAGGGVINGERLGGAARAVGARPASRSTRTLMGLGAFPAPHPQWLGMLGMHGTRAANYAMDEADLILAVGARFDDRITGKL